MAGFWANWQQVSGKQGRQRWSTIGAIGLTLGVMAQAQAAAPPTNLNQQLQTLHNRMDQAANARDRDSLLQFYGLEFTNNDGLNRETFSQSLGQLWQQYPQLTYKTEVLQATPQGQGADVETVLRITGDQQRDGRTLKVDITLRSRQRWQADKLIQQEILSEQTRLSLGERPPTVTVNLPETVKVGERYTYEAIVQEPLDTDILMGEILDQPVTVTGFTQPKPWQLELPSVLELVGNQNFIRLNRPDPKVQSINLKRLRSGGFFKSAQAPKTAENRWLSAVLVRHDAGLTIVTQRLRVVE
jgi:hypothetical protein